ncbi:MAG: hypothetical protein RIQ52_666 [Pseudomonadota bacterium]
MSNPLRQPRGTLLGVMIAMICQPAMALHHDHYVRADHPPLTVPLAKQSLRSDGAPRIAGNQALDAADKVFFAKLSAQRQVIRTRLKASVDARPSAVRARSQSLKDNALRSGAPSLQRPARQGHKLKLAQSAAVTLQPASQTYPDLELHYHANGAPRMIRARLPEHTRTQQVRPALHARSVVMSLEAGKRSDITTARNFLGQYHQLLRLKDTASELHLVSEHADRLQQRHIVFDQWYQGLQVWPARLVVHTTASGDVAAVSGSTAPTPDRMALRPVVSAERAARIGVAAVTHTSPQAAVKPELVIYMPQEQSARLAWKMQVGVSMHERQQVVVDARSGEVISHWNLLPHAQATGSGVDLFGKTQTLSLWQDSKGLYNLINTSIAMYDGTSDPMLPDTRGVITIRDARNQPPNSDPQTTPVSYVVSSASPTSKWLKDGVSAASNLATVYSYYRERHGRNSIDGKGSAIIGVVRLGKKYDNAFYDSSINTMFFGDAARYAGALDVVGHEMTHGITAYTANLIYQDQSGALNEAVSDIFGEMIEAYANNGQADWVISAQLGTPFRNLITPGSLEAYPGKPYPASMAQYITTTDDDGGVHTNSTIIGHAFYLMTKGAPANGLSYLEAEKILYRALSVYLTPSSQFMDARLQCLQAAEDLYGAGSKQVQQVAWAFDSVGLTDNGSSGGGSSGGDEGNTDMPLPIAEGDDNLVFLAMDGDYPYLGRRETALGDPVEGVLLSDGPADWVRPSVSRDGTTATFVSSSKDVCWILTDGSSAEECLGEQGKVYSVAMSPDGNRLAFVMNDSKGRPKAEITLWDVNTDERTTFKLVAPTTAKDHSVSSISHADAMTFTSDGHYLIYDAENILPLASGGRITAYSIYAIDLSSQNGNILTLIPPQADRDIGNPAASHNHPSLLAYESEDKETGASDVYTVDLDTGDTTPVVSISDLGFPGFSGDDSAIIYTEANPDVNTGGDLWRVALPSEADPQPLPQLLMQDADMGVVYRRADWKYLNLSFSGKGYGQVSSTPAAVDCQTDCSTSFEPGAALTLEAQPQPGSRFANWSGACSGTEPGCSLVMDQDQSVTASFVPIKTYKLSVRMSGPAALLGSAGVTAAPVSGGSFSCVKTQCTGIYEEGSRVTLTPVVPAGGRFVSWSLPECKSSTANCTVSMSKAKSVTATFARVPVKK